MDSHFLLRRISSLAGVVPIGLFLVYHLYIQLYLHSGAEIYNKEVNINFIKFIRREKKFKGLEQLKKQIKIDIIQAKKNV